MEHHPIRMRNGDMKNIALLRHAKSEWDIGTPSDFDRPISEKGRLNAELMGRYIKRECGEYTHALVSTARRCRETFAVVSDQFDQAPEAVFDERIYLASAGNLLELVQEQGDDFNDLLIVGHNPGLTYFALDLIRQDDAVIERERIAEKFPTSAFVKLECDVEKWADLGTAACSLTTRRYPIDEDE